MNKDDLTQLTQSRYYSPVLNAAIFDGPIRIYFDQSQEAGALKLYFSILNEYKVLCGGLQSERVDNSQSVFILIYPDAELFEMVSEEAPVDSEFMFVDKLGADKVIALRGVPDELQTDDITQRLTSLTPILPETHPTPV